MCKLSLNIVSNVYNSLQSSFWSLAWPWPGKSLPKGNQCEWWDPQQGPLPDLCEVGHSPRGTSGGAGTLDWGPMWSDSQSTCHLQCTPYTPDGSPMPPWHPYTLRSAQCPLIPPIPLLAPEHLHSLPDPQCTLDTPYTPDGPLTPSDITLQLTIFMSMSSLQYTILRCQEYICSAVKLSNFCNISQNMYSKVPVALQHWKTNKVVWTWKDDWPPWRTSTYERPFTWEGNYLVFKLELQHSTSASMLVHITYRKEDTTYRTT